MPRRVQGPCTAGPLRRARPLARPLILAALLAGATALAAPFAAPLSAQSTPDAGANPEPFTLALLEPFFEATGAPGCAVGVYRGGEIIDARGFGEANLDWGIPFAPNTVVYAGSLSKQFTAATAALLHLRGDLDLDGDVRLHIPELPPYDPPVTVRHLVHHVSGVRDIYGLISLSGGNTADLWSDADYLDLLARQTDLNFPAGTEYLYSNGGYFLLTTVIERVTGKRLDDAARELIFGPLGMHDTHFHQDRERIVPRRAMSYQGGLDEGFRQSYLGNFDKAGAGGLYTTIEDLAAWNRNFETGEVGGPAFLELIHTRGVLASGDTLAYAFGLQHGSADGHRTVGHSGSFMGFRADFVRFPDAGLAVAALCNLGSIDPQEITRGVAREFLGPVAEPAGAASGDATPPAAPPEPAAAPGAETRPPLPAALPTHAGVYHSAEVGASWGLRHEGDSLVLRRTPGASGQALVWQGGNRFRAGSQTLAFEFEGGVPAAFRLDAGRVKNLKFTRVRE
jgi:CubicO group peptidase (beta-lactamase class C family)